MQKIELHKRNYLSMIIEGSFYNTGMAFIDVNAVIPVFIFAYTNSVLLAGLATTLYYSVSFIIQFLSGPYVKEIKNMPVYICYITLFSRPLPFLMIPILFSRLNPWQVVGAFFFLYTLFCSAKGLIVLPWYDIFSRTINPAKRGILQGYQQLFGGIGALIAGFIVKKLLEDPDINNPQRYAAIFFLAGFVLTVSSFAMMTIRDLPRERKTQKLDYSTYYRRLPQYLRQHKTFQTLMIVRILASIANMIAPFMIIFSQTEFQLSVVSISNLVYIQIIGGLLGGVIWGKISSRYGNHQLIMYSQILGLIIPLLAMTLRLINGQDLPVFVIGTMVFANGINMNGWIGFINYTIDIVSEADRTVYLLLNNIVIFPFSFLAFFAGITAQYIGYMPVFLVSTLAAATAVFYAKKLQQVSPSVENKKQS